MLPSIRQILPPPRKSWMQVLAELPVEERNELLKELEKECSYGELLKAWWFIGRREQLPPQTDWIIWLILAGRGWGKTASGSHWLIDQHKNCPDDLRNFPTGIVAATNEDLKRYCLRGPSGVLSQANDTEWSPKYEPHNARLVWPDGSETLLFSSEKPERLRGPNLRAVWADELASWSYLQECWDNLEFSLRGSRHPRIVITTTPKPKALLRAIIKQPTTAITSGSTFDNSANLAPTFLKRVREMYENTTIGKQELYAQLLDESSEALWNRRLIEENRIQHPPLEITRQVIALDPAVSSSESSNETGIIRAASVTHDHAYVLEDLSGVYTPDGWARKAILCYFANGCDAVVAERNNGGEMVEHTLKTVAKDLYDQGLTPSPHVRIKTVWASKGKVARAEPVSALYEQHKVSHVGAFNELEDQMVTYVPHSGNKSPDRYDALVWAITDLMLGRGIPVPSDCTSEFLGRLMMADAELFTPQDDTLFPLTERMH